MGDVMGSRKEAQIITILHVQVDDFGTGFVRNKHPLQKCQLFDHSALFRKYTRKIRMVKSQVYTCTADVNFKAKRAEWGAVEMGHIFCTLLTGVYMCERFNSQLSLVFMKK